MEKGQVEMWCWGANSYGQLGLGPAQVCEQHEVPQAVPLAAMAASVSLGGGHTVVVDEQARVWVAGDNGKGQLGIDRSRQRVHHFIRVDLPEDVDMCDAACGWDFTFLRCKDGRVLASGSNAFGQLGWPQAVHALDRFQVVQQLHHHSIVQVACGMRHSVFLDSSGSVFVAGCAKKGQLGPLSSEDKKIFGVLPLDVGEAIRQVAAGQFHTILLCRDSSDFFVFGDNRFGQLGAEQSANAGIASRRVSLDLSIKMLRCGWTHTVALASDGRLYSWGRNNYGQLGRKTDGSEKSLIGLVCPELRFNSVSCGYEHGLAIDQQHGSLLSWGWNEHANCGHPVREGQHIWLPQRVPLPYANDCRVLSCYAGSGHSFALISRH